MTQIPHLTPSVTLRFGVFFDGTANNQANAVTDAGVATGGGGSYANALSNVALLHRLYPNGPDPQRPRHYRPLYFEGVGTRAGQPDARLDQASGAGATGVEARVRQALVEVAEQVRRWPSEHPQQALAGVEFDLFGFSRGAAAARHFANVLLVEVGDTSPWQASLKDGVTINFIGLYDTVAAIFDPFTSGHGSGSAGLGGLRLGLAEGLARQVVQLVAADERRHNFPLIASGHDLVLPGAHADIGGGYLPRMMEAVLLSKPFSSRVSVAMAAGDTAAYQAATQALEALPQVQRAGTLVRTWEVLSRDHHARREAPYKQVYAAPCREREVWGDLSRVYLSILRELAVVQGVPFAPLPAPLLALPADLLEISARLHDYALGCRDDPGLDAAQMALLHARYIHTSAHWNAVSAWRESVLDGVFINRPTADGVRQVHRDVLEG
ncbi:DUF2235 domain-containing protein [Pseudomonas sp. RP23018S]|uniref:T6SS phospholipase effector Tle1-like catalytic domain-containing protein n=1 Tax=Pseudomonas sp. RP23018S TaxID=3096037 RepID=UPI002ACA0463|nr:DUF2235 domain-containing protein [Pseudomonas sp. RP23018S]MDZ5602258.1 DUF2235 domain-containing protein [Pseudomonas sp. RP23018S]